MTPRQHTYQTAREAFRAAQETLRAGESATLNTYYEALDALRAAALEVAIERARKRL
jgi:hypothetical protein